MSEATPMIGFPPSLLGEKPLRLPVLYLDEEVLVLPKPVGVVASEDPWALDAPNLEAAINVQVERGKPELERLSITRPVRLLAGAEVEESGGVLYTLSPEAGEAVRNAYGSGHYTFRYTLITPTAKEMPEECACDLPIAIHEAEPKVLVSHKTGKQAETVFRLEQDYGGWQRWSAEIPYLRKHHVRLHAMEVGLKIVGEELYGQVPPITRGDIKPHARGPGASRVLYYGLALHLDAIAWERPEGQGEVHVPMPKPLQRLLRDLENRAAGNF